VAYESGAQLLRSVPIATFATFGALRLADGRLSFHRRSTSDPVFDVPVDEIHSVRPVMSLGLHVWHGTSRYRIAVGLPSILAATTGVPTGDVGAAAAGLASLPARAAHDAVNRLATTTWIDLLTAAQGEPPPGLRVRPPWPPWAWWLGIVGATAALMAAIVVLTLASG
jgi:hypothetical protein